MGVELEGAELLERFKEGVTQFLEGANDLVQNETTGEAQRQMTIGKTNNAQQSEQIQQDGAAKTRKALINMKEGGTEAIKGGTQVVGTSLENVGDAITVAGVATAQPEVIAVGETIGTTGSILNAAVDLSDGVPVQDIAIEFGVEAVVGEAGNKAVKTIRKKGATTYQEAFVKLAEGAWSDLITPVIQNSTPPLIGPIEEPNSN